MKLGDAVKKITDAAGIPQCGGCKQRQDELNRIGEAGAAVARRMRDRFRARFYRPSTPR